MCSVEYYWLSDLKAGVLCLSLQSNFPKNQLFLFLVRNFSFHGNYMERLFRGPSFVSLVLHKTSLMKAMKTQKNTITTTNHVIDEEW